jgi:hypothetical protein
MKKRPRGAITETKLRQLYKKTGLETGNYDQTVGRGYYAVRKNLGIVEFGSNCGGFVFGLTTERYYFTNYFHALAYSLQLRARRGQK